MTVRRPSLGSALKTEPDVLEYVADRHRDLGTWEDFRFDQAAEGDEQQGKVNRDKHIDVDLVGVHKEGSQREGIRPLPADE